MRSKPEQRPGIKVVRLWAAIGRSLHLEDIADVSYSNASNDKTLETAASLYTSTTGKSRDMFLAVLAHDLRNPLTSISVVAFVLQPGDKLSVEHEGGVSQISGCVA